MNGICKGFFLHFLYRYHPQHCHISSQMSRRKHMSPHRQRQPEVKVNRRAVCLVFPHFTRLLQIQEMQMIFSRSASNFGGRFTGRVLMSRREENSDKLLQKCQKTSVKKRREKKSPLMTTLTAWDLSTPAILSGTTGQYLYVFGGPRRSLLFSPLSVSYKMKQ